MKGIRILSALLVILTVALAFPMYLVTVAADDGEFMCAYSAQSNSGDYKKYMYYGSTAVNRLTSEEAEQNGIPQGYSGDVLEVENRIDKAKGKGILLDFSHLNIPTDLIKSITFRVCVGTDGTTNDIYPEVRIIKPNSKSWVMRYNASNQTGQWLDITIDSSGTNFLSGATFADVSKDGCLNMFELGVRSHEGDPYFYIDSITYMLNEPVDEVDFSCEFYASTDPNYMKYGSSAVVELTAQKAEEMGIPSGFSGNVLSVENSTPSRGVLLDFSSWKVPYALIKSMTFRVYVGDDGTVNDDYPEVRIIQPGEETWVMRYNIKDKTERWIDITLDNDGKNFSSGKRFELLCKDGLLDRFELSVRSYQGDIAFYIDSVSFSLIEDKNPPKISYEGKNSLVFFEGEKPILDIKAYDEEMKSDVELTWTWSDPAALNSNGTLNQGSYTLTLSASDYHKNTASKVFSVTVKEADTEPPVIHSGGKEMYLQTGTIPRLNPVVTDNSNRFEFVSFWSEGALDNRGRLNEGLYLYTMIATDYSGNKTIKKIIVYVMDEIEENGYIIDEEKSVIIGGTEGDEKDEGDMPPPSDNTTDPPAGDGSSQAPSDVPNTPVAPEKGEKGCASTSVGAKEIVMLLLLPALMLIYRRRRSTVK